MKQYLQLIRNIRENGEWTFNERTQKRTQMLPGAVLTFDLRKGFPAVTTKKLAFKTLSGELCAFLRASRSAADFRALGCKVWDQNANENAQWLANPFRKGPDDLGPVYGVQWREWPGFKVLKFPPAWFKRNMNLLSDEERCQVETHKQKRQGLKASGWEVVAEDKEVNAEVWYKEIDQLGECVRKIIENPSDRRNLFHAWNPAVLDEVALPACHLLYQFLPNSNNKTLHLNLYQRSCDEFLGVPLNIAEAASLQMLIARLTGYTAGLLNVMQGDAHIYEDHIEQVDLQLTREPYELPELAIDCRVPFGVDADTAIEWLRKVEPSDFTLVGYQHHEAIAAPMAV